MIKIHQYALVLGCAVYKHWSFKSRRIKFQVLCTELSVHNTM